MSSKLTDGLCPAMDCYRRTIPLHLGNGGYVYYCQSENMVMNYPTPYMWVCTYDEDYTSNGVIVVGNTETNQFVLAGALTCNYSLTHFLVRSRGSIPDYIEVRQDDIPADGSLPPEEIVMLEGNDWKELLKQYADLVAKKAGVAPIKPKENLCGYCSWYYYYDTISEEDFMENVDYMEQARKDGLFPASVVQIDDGYQTFQGDWNDQGSTWKTPLKEIAGRIASKGMVPGIWLMPFQASTVSRVFREHPDWFVKDEITGEPKVVNGWSTPPNNHWGCLDASNPEVLEHLKKVFRTFHEWGFRYYKLDGMGFGLQKGVRMDPKATPVSAFRAALKAIREAVPEDYILGCTAPFSPCVGFCDGMRISRDTKAHWKYVMEAWREIIARFWMYDRWFRCDPDALIVRQNLGTLTPGEARFSALGGIITGVSITSDNLSLLDVERKALLAKTAKYRLENATPGEWPVWSWPEIIHGTINGKKAVAVFNWRDTEATYTCEQMGFARTEQLRELLGAVDGVWGQLTLPPHDAALIVQR